MAADRRQHLLARRIAAYLVDMLLLFAVLAPAGFVVQASIGVRPETGPEIWRFLLLTFSLPAWTYFWLFESLAGATPGKRLTGLGVERVEGGRPGLAQALARTVIKLLPWELVHLSAFGLSRSMESLAPIQATGLVLAWALIGIWLVAAVRSGGGSGIHDRIVGTRVVRRAPAAGRSPDGGPEQPRQRNS